MKYLKRFNEDITATIGSNGVIKPNHNVKSDVINTIYDKRWEGQLPPFITINYHGELYKFKRDNIMLHSDMVQITYASTPMDGQESEEIWGKEVYVELAKFSLAVFDEMEFNTKENNTERVEEIEELLGLLS